jgi:hypothetical protein
MAGRGPARLGTAGQGAARRRLARLAKARLGSDERPAERTIARQEDMIRRLDVKQQRTEQAIAESRQQQAVAEERITAVEEALKRHGIDGDA